MDTAHFFLPDEFRHTLDQIPLMVCASAPDGAHYFYNKAWLAFTGRAAEQQSENGPGQDIHPDDLRHSLDIYVASLKSRSEFKRTYRLKRHDGEYRWIAEKCKPQYEPGGAFAGYIGYGLDIDDLLEDTQLKDDLLSAKARQKHDFDEELASTNEELSTANEELIATNEELHQTQENLAELNRQLENIVAVRTKALQESEQKAQALNEELAAANEELAASNEELATTNEELATTNEELISTNEELTKSREEIQKSEKLFKSIAVNIPKSLVVVIGHDHRFIAFEGDLIVKLGYNSRDFIGKHPTEIAALERYEATKPLYDRALAGEQFTVYRRGEHEEYYRMEFVPLRNDDNEVYAALVIALDITDIKQAEEKSAKLAAIVTSSDDAIISKTTDGIITSWNEGAERMFGYTEKEMIGQPMLKIIPGDRKDEEPRILDRLVHGERTDHFETKRLAKDGKELDVSVTISPVKDSNGNIIGASTIARDISVQKRDEQRKNDFIGMVSHELKTPLTSLTAIVQLLQLKLRAHDDTFVANSMTNAGRQVKKMADLINGFLNISRLESGKMPMVERDFVLNDLIKEAIEETRLMGPDHDIRFNCDEHMIVHADRDKIGSVILNLLNNAVKYSPKASKIDVGCKIIKNRMQVSVTDQGIGIKPNDLEKLFERYYRVESPDTQHVSGFGIGLYLSSEIVKQHHGHIWAESEPGKGSTFYFDLPLKA